MFGLLKPVKEDSNKVCTKSNSTGGERRSRFKIRRSSFGSFQISTTRPNSRKMSHDSSATALFTTPTTLPSSSSPNSGSRRFGGLSRLPRPKGDNSGGKVIKKASRDESTMLFKINRERLESWSESFYELLTDRVGVRLFEEFLIKECSQENIQFWKACKRYSDPHLTPDHALQTAAESIFTEYISHQAPNVVNIDHTVRTEVVGNMRSISRNTFDKAMSSVYMLMERDSYSRFIKQPEFREALALSRV